MFGEIYIPKTSNISRNIKYSIDENGCWNCISHKPNSNGYPDCRIGGKRSLVNRFVYILYGNVIPEGFLLRHTCDNRLCINPEHLLTGTHQDNSDDKLKRNRQVKGESVNSAKLTQKQVIEIRNSKLPQSKLSEIYGICQSGISRIKNNKMWKHVS